MKKNLGTLLVESKLVTEKVLSEALQRQVIFGGRLGTNLIEMGAVPEESILKLLSHQHNVSYASGEHFNDIPQSALDSIPKDLLEKFRIIPIRADRNRVTVAMEDPTLLDVIDEISFKTDKVIQSVVATELRITSALEHYYGIRRVARYIQAVPSSTPSARPEDVVQIREEDLASQEPQEIPEADLEPIDPLDMTDINESFWSVNNRDDVAQAVVQACLRVMDDTFMFILKGDTAIGWMGGGSLEPPAHFGAWQKDLEPGGIFGIIRETRAIQRGGGQDLYTSNPWLDDFSVRAPAEIITCPLVLKKHTVAAVIGFSWERQLDDEEIEFLVRAMRKASVSFEILILKSRILML